MLPDKRASTCPETVWWGIVTTLFQLAGIAVGIHSWRGVQNGRLYLAGARNLKKATA